MSTTPKTDNTLLAAVVLVVALGGAVGVAYISAKYVAQSAVASIVDKRLGVVEKTSKANAEAVATLRKTSPSDVLAYQRDNITPQLDAIRGQLDEAVTDRFRGRDMDRWLTRERERTGDNISPWRDAEGK